MISDNKIRTIASITIITIITFVLVGVIIVTALPVKRSSTSGRPKCKAIEVINSMHIYCIGIDCVNATTCTYDRCDMSDKPIQEPCCSNHTDYKSVCTDNSCINILHNSYVPTKCNRRCFEKNVLSAIMLTPDSTKIFVQYTLAFSYELMNAGTELECKKNDNKWCIIGSLTSCIDL